MLLPKYTEIGIRPLISKANRIIISNVQTCIPNAVIEDELKKINVNPVSYISQVRAGMNDPGFSHIQSFKDQELLEINNNNNNNSEVHVSQQVGHTHFPSPNQNQKNEYPNLSKLPEFTRPLSTSFSAASQDNPNNTTKNNPNSPQIKNVKKKARHEADRSIVEINQLLSPTKEYLSDNQEDYKISYDQLVEFIASTFGKSITKHNYQTVTQLVNSCGN